MPITDPVEPWVDAVHDRLVAAGQPAASVLDAGCGSGRHAAAHTAKGHYVDLADAAGELLEQAAAHCPAAQVHRVDLCTLDVRRNFHALTCRGVLNDMLTDTERDSVLPAFAGCLRDGGLLLLDVREAYGSRERADATPHQRTGVTPSGMSLTFTSTVTWSAGMLHIHEQYDLFAEGALSRSSSYDFTMRPWSERELRQRLRRAGFQDIEIRSGVGRKTADRLFVVAVRSESSTKG